MSKTIKMPYHEYDEHMKQVIEEQQEALEDYKKAGNVVILDSRQVNGHGSAYGSYKTVFIPRFRGELEVVEELDADYKSLEERVERVAREYREEKHKYMQERAELDARVEAEVKRRVKKNWLQKLLGL